MALEGGARTVVVGAASRHGSTAEIARRVVQVMSDELSGAWVVRLGDTDDLRTFDGADAVVLGSAVYLGHWLRPALKTLRHVKDAPLLDLWLFSTGPVSDDFAENASIITADGMVSAGCAVEHQVFGGRLEPAALSRWERGVLRLVKAGRGDHRDWAVIDAWAVSIASQLSDAVAEPRGRA